MAAMQWWEEAPSMKQDLILDVVFFTLLYTLEQESPGPYIRAD